MPRIQQLKYDLITWSDMKFIICTAHITLSFVRLPTDLKLDEMLNHRRFISPIVNGRSVKGNQQTTQSQIRPLNEATDQGLHCLQITFFFRNV